MKRRPSYYEAIRQSDFDAEAYQLSSPDEQANLRLGPAYWQNEILGWCIIPVLAHFMSLGGLAAV